MDTINLILISILNIVCFLVGYVLGNRNVEHKPITIKTPKEIVDSIRLNHEYEEFKHDMEINQYNIDNYDPYNEGLGQKNF